MGPQNAGRIRYGILAAIGLVHAAAVYGFIQIVAHGMSWADFAWALSLFAIGGIGITAGYHRLWTHRSFECTPFVEWLLAVMGTLPLEGDIYTWYKNHFQHHHFVDEPGDPHSPVVDGFWWAHIGWLFRPVAAPPGYRQVTFQDANPIVQWQKRWYWPLAIGLGFILPLAYTWSLSTLWLAGFIRVVFFWHVTWAVNSVCHKWGRGPRGRSGEPLVRRDASTDNAIVAYLGFGEGWHATHHADPNSYDLGVGRWDPGKWFIDFWAYLGSVTRRNAYSR